MIDTIRVRAPIPSYVFSAIEDKKTVSINSTGLMKLLGVFTVPPFNSTVSVSTRDYKYVYLETSLPKTAYGHNVKLLYPLEIPTILKRIEITFIQEFGEIPHWQEWEVQRLDACYAWKYDTQEEAVKILNFMNSLEYPDKDKHYYPNETVTFGGRSFSITFYIKNKEFIKYGFNKLKKNDFLKLAEEIEEFSRGVLRFEVRLFKPKLKALLGKEIINPNDILNLEFYYNILNACLVTALRNSNRNSISDYDALEKLKIYKSSIALRLFCFWRTYYLIEPHIKTLIKANTASTSISRNMQAISEAGVGIPEAYCPLPFELSIPSKFAVTPEPLAPVAPATEQDKKPMGVQQMFDELFKK